MNVVKFLGETSTPEKIQCAFALSSNEKVLIIKNEISFFSLDIETDNFKTIVVKKCKFLI